MKKYSHLREVHMNDTDEVHIILGASDFAKIKMEKIPRLGK